MVAILGRIGLLAVLGQIGLLSVLGQIGLVAVLGVLAVFGLLVVHNGCGQRFGGGQQGSVGFLRARQANVMELDGAIRAAALSGNDLAALIVYQLKAEVVLLGQGAAFQMLGGTQVKGKSRGHCGIVDVGKLGAINDLIAQLIHRGSGDQCTVVYQIHMDGNSVPLVIVGEAASAAIVQFADGVAIVARLGKGQGGGKGHAAVGLVLAESNLAGCVLHHKGELVVLQGAVNVAFQLLGGSQRYGRRQVVAGGVGGNVVHHCRVLDLAVGTGDRVVDRDHKAYDAALGGACLDGPFQLAGLGVQRAAVGDGFFNQSGVGGDLVGDGNGNGCGLAVDPTDGVGQLLAGRYQLAVDTCAAFARHALGRQRVEVHEAGRAAGNGGTILAQRGGGHQLAGCGVVGHSHGHGVLGGVPLDVRVVGVGVLGDGVRVGADCIVIDAAEAAAHSLAGGTVQRQGIIAVGGHRGTALRGQRKGEAFAISPGAADQGLAYRQGKRGVGCLVGVGKGRHSGGGRLVIRVAAVTVGGAAVVGDRAANQLAFMVIRNIHFDLIVVGVVGDAGDGFSVLGDIIGVNARRGERQLIAAAQCGRIVRAGAADNSNAVVLGRHVRGIRTRQLKAEDIAALPRAAPQILLDFEQGRSVGHAGVGAVDVVKQGSVVSRALVGVGDSRLQLAVIAQRDLDRCGDGVCLGDAGQLGVILGDGVGIGADLIKGKLAERRMLAAFVDRHRGGVGYGGVGGGLGSYGKAEIVAIRPIHGVPLCIQEPLVQFQRGFGLARIVGVGKGDGGVAAVGSGHFVPGTILILVIGDIHFHVSRGGGGIGIGGAVIHVALYKVGVSAVGDVGVGACFFTDEIVISFADIRVGKGDGFEVDPAVGVVGRCGRAVCRQGDRIQVIAYCLASLVLAMRHNGKAEPPGGKAGGVGRINVNFPRGQVDDFFRSAVGVCKGSGIDCIAGRLTVNNFLDGGRGAQLAAVIPDRDGHTVDGAVVRNTHDLVVAGVDLVDIVLVSAGLGKGDTAEVEGNGSIRRSAPGLGKKTLYIVCARRSAFWQRGVAGGEAFQTELELVARPPVAAGQRFRGRERIFQRDGFGLVTVGNGHQRGGGAGLAGLDRNGGLVVGKRTGGDGDAVQLIACGGSAIGVVFILAYGDGAACGQAKDLGSLTGL